MQHHAEAGDELAAGVGIANIPTLLMVLYQMTGDARWLAAPYAPNRPYGIDDNDSGRLPEAIQAEIRAAALAAIRAHLAGRPLAVPRPSDAQLVRMLSVSMADEVPPSYGQIIAHGLGLPPEKAPQRVPLRIPSGFKVVVIGAGVSGIIAGVGLQDAGFDFEILEKNEDFGGTWYGNRYPGAGVDTPNHLYSFSFSDYDWPKYFSLRDEIHDYLQSTARRFGLDERTRFGTRVERLAYDPSSAEWRISGIGANGQPFEQRANAVISAVGVLDIPLVPEIPGLDSFPGDCFHTAQWPAGLDLTGRRVAVIGNGASSMQVVPAIADQVAAVTIFARSKQWAAPFPKFKAPVPAPIRALFRSVPLYQQWYRQRLAWTFNDRIHPTIQVDPDWPHPERSLNATNEAHRRAFEAYVRDELGDRQDLFDAVVPDFPPFAKRMLLDNGWFRTVARDHVTLVPDRLARVEGSTLIGADGSRHEADVLILGTGFRAADFLASLEVTGAEGQRLSEVWNGDDARAYLGTAIPGFPNLFTLLGPNVGLGHGGSVIAPIEAQMGYLCDLLARMFDSGAAAVEVKPEVHDAYNVRVDAAHERMVFAHKGTSNWYRNSRGRIVAITPWRHDDFWRMMHQADLSDYRLLGTG
ncbi:flavin-containing monooxygenase [Pararhodobacter aggregans]|uniref:Monooxygenase n=1 Tax=Pararhodobacter aggregans TaxID=404875 RepID=A0A2T7USQ4_9RHOB|nr:NAD(P)/FAD-dependent oxidoreductase [Pararhodobacter aggregans]PTX03351.1 4-hydroxyacetophenone monooxygenase [Pararhodobacter aggregans]PVE47649.1 monooxygenase [Pararhodobacter aggregans]